MDDGRVDQADVGWREGSVGTTYSLSALRRQSPLVILTMIIVGGLAFAYAVTVEPLYTASSEVRVRIDPEDTVSPEISPLNTHIELIQSEAVTAEVIERVGLAPIEEIRPGRLRQVITAARKWLDFDTADGPAEFDPEAALIRSLALGLEVESIGYTPLIMIRYTSYSSELAAELANAYAQTYVDQNTEQTDRSLQRRRERLEQRAEEVRQQALDANRTAQALLADSGFVVVSTEELGRRIADFRERLSAIDAEEATLTTRLERITSVEADDDLSKVSLGTDETARIYADLQDASKLLERLRALPGTPESTKAQIEDNIANFRIDLERELNRYREELRAELAVVAAKRQNILAERDQVISYQQSDAWSKLVITERKVATYEAIYQSYVQDLEDLNRQERNLPVSFVSEARPPAFPSFPDYKIILAFGVTIGVVLGGALALLREWNRPH